jgi:hypothetical protein
LSRTAEVGILPALVETQLAIPVESPRAASAPIPLPRLVALGAFCAAAVLLIALHWWVPGGLSWGLALILALRDPEPAFRRRVGVLLGCLLVLALAPIRTDTSNENFLALGSVFLAVVLVPYLILRRTDPGVIRYILWPRCFRWIDLFYVVISIPLSWGAFLLYFNLVNPNVPTHWVLPPLPQTEPIWRLFIGINLVGIWDELFFINTVYAVLRSMLPYRVANLGQAVVYTSVLYQMAFTGIGPVFIYIFALTQGAMFEESESLLYVILVHLIVDFFLVAGILHHYYPGYNPLPL